MQHPVELPAPLAPIKFYYNEKVYSPEFTSMDTIALALLLFEQGIPFISVLDVGCGSGVLGLTLKKLLPDLWLTLTDIDYQATKITALNAKRLGLDCDILEADLLPSVGGWDCVIANLPTFRDADMAKYPLHGPETAYYAGKDALRLYRRLFKEATGRTSLLIVECQEQYQEGLQTAAMKAGWSMLVRNNMAFAFYRD